MKLKSLGWNAHFERSFEPFRASGFEPARVFREERLMYLVCGERDEMPAEITGKFRHEANVRIDFPAVGDWVAIQPMLDEGKAMIHGLLPRISKFSRKVASGPSNRTEEQIVAANIDTVFLVSGLDREFNVRRIERYLAAARESGAKPVIVLNKADLHDDSAPVLAEVRAVAGDVPVHAVSATENHGLDALKPYLKRGKTVALLGSSGVGKSSLVNALLDEERQFTIEVREKDSRGRHATTYRELIILPSGAMLIDNPGLRELQLWTEERALDQAFDDIDSLALRCRFRDCRHASEPDCAVQAALAGGKLDAARWESYLKLQRERQHLVARQDALSRRTEKERSKRIAKARKQYHKVKE